MMYDSEIRATPAAATPQGEFDYGRGAEPNPPIHEQYNQEYNMSYAQPEYQAGYNAGGWNAGQNDGLNSAVNTDGTRYSVGYRADASEGRRSATQRPAEWSNNPGGKYPFVYLSRCQDMSLRLILWSFIFCTLFGIVIETSSEWIYPWGKLESYDPSSMCKPC